jgi:endogenous inhibitor of DNA gyrase (YacG/DUF329 family)
MTDENRPVPPRSRARCPSCGVPLPSHDPAAPTSRPTWAPFCSERCKMVDLARWLRGEQAIPGEPVHIAEDEGEA